MEWSDARLVAECRRGNQQAYAHLVDTYQRLVYSVSYRLLDDPTEAEDAAQEAFLAAFRGLDTFREGAPLAPWLSRIAHNHCLRRLRKRNPGTVSLEEQPLPDMEPLGQRIADPAPSPEDLLTQSEIRAALESAILSLPVHYRTAVTLRYLHDFSYAEVSEALNLPLGTVKAQLHRARGLLREQLETVWMEAYA
ncbi:MAG: sigma-70 family RNA polymerase sigma factor [Chloroflexi bacterium]|nr:sigma-70 family RNA polymerase sigma factor [Chloroflexota bacterium]MBU1750754.1 sigma-70 family RNA polymerase sigma factor [Chloroflexota bacterium]MBU1877424.1 sigma-70 family RNA polymerase sigma factor [Chloroflexota bacterium]